MATNPNSPLLEAERRMARAGSVREVGRVVCDTAEQMIGSSAVNFFPFAPAPAGEKNAYSYSSESPTEKINADLVRFAAHTERETMTIRDLFCAPGCAVNLNEHLGQDYLDKTVVYNEFWREHRIERQVILGMGNLQEPLGFIACARKITDRPFQREDIVLLKSLRNAAQLSVRQMSTTSMGQLVTEEILETMGTLLPVAFWLFDQRGRLVWMNREAVLRIDASVMRACLSDVINHKPQAVDDLQRLALAVTDEPARAVAARELDHTSISLLRPGERLDVRYLDRQFGGQPMVLFAIREGRTPVSERLKPGKLRRLGLTTRESEVASLAAQGYSMVNISAKLGVKESTVHSHMKRIYEKLGVANRAELACRLLTEID